MLVIRPEARAVSWDALNKGQQDALIRILKMIECSLPKKPPKPSGTHQRQIPYISDDRSSRLAFLDGGRGTGKSTVLTSLQKIIKEGKIESSSNQPTIDRDLINSVRDNVIWLETIDMEPTPPNWNMLPAILSRFEQAYNQHCRQAGEDGNYQNRYPGLLEPSHNHHETMRELLQLQNNIALSWNGNLHDRSSQLDPDAYALETMRVEQARLGLNPCVERVLDSMAYEIRRVNPRANPLFILPIDDFDMNPIVCLELLRILRMLSVPRLFTLMLGDLEIVDIVLNLKLSNDLNSVCPNIRKEMLSIELHDVAMAAGRTAANAIHKLLPPMQCIQLRLMTVHEGLDFYPLGDYSKNDKYRLYQKLQQCKIEFGKHSNNEDETNNKNQPSNTFPCKIFSLSEFFLLKGLPVIDKETNSNKEKFDLEDFCKPKQTDEGDNDSFEREDLRESFYSGRQILETVPRYATDIWFSINRFIELIERSTIDEHKKWIKLLELVAELCRSVLLRDRTLDPESRRLTRGSFFKNYLDGWDFESIPIKISSVLDNGHFFSTEIHASVTNDNKKLTCKLNAFKALKWQFKLATNVKENSEIPDAYGIEYKHIGKDFFSAHHLENDTTGAMIFFHDLLVLGPTFRSHSFLLTPGIEHVKENAWCTTTWQDGLAYQVELPWYRPRCLSFWGLDLFLFAWNHAIDELKEDVLKEPELSLDTLAFAWISAGTGVISNRTPVSNKVNKKWEVLGKELANMTNGYQSKPLSEQFNSWLISVALMIMPETGLTEIKDISEIYNNMKLRDFWSTYYRTICNYRYDRLKKIYDANMQELSMKLFHYQPNDFKETNSFKEIPFDKFRPEIFKELISGEGDDKDKKE